MSAVATTRQSEREGPGSRRDEPPAERRARRRWSLIIVGLLLLNLSAGAVLVLSARGDPSHHVEQDYYQRALAWDETVAQRRRSQQLGWRVQLELLALAGGGVRVQLGLVDRLGEAVHGAMVRMTAFHEARAGHRLVRTLTAAGGAGHHHTVLLRPRPGRWKLSFEVTRGNDRFTTTLDREIVTAKPGDR